MLKERFGAGMPALLIRLIAGCLLLQGWISRALWLPGSRAFPRLPVVANIEWPASVQWLLLTAACAALFGLLLKPQNRLCIAVFLGVAVPLILEDVNRLQPWLFSFSIILAANLAAGNRDSLPKWTIAAVLSGTYVWSGLHKLNPNFATEFFPWLANVLVPETWLQAYPWLAYVAAGTELLAGIGLWLPATRKYALGVVVVLHAFILCSLGPWGHNWNPVVWPWNVTFALLALSVFWRSSPALPFGPRRWYGGLVIALVAVAPLLNTIGAWDHFLSASYYTNLSPEAVFVYHENDRARLTETPGNYQYAIRDSDQEFIILAAWALATLEVPGYPEERTYKQLGRTLCDCVENKAEAGLRLVRKQRLRYEIEEEFISCEELSEREQFPPGSGQIAAHAD